MANIRKMTLKKQLELIKKYISSLEESETLVNEIHRVVPDNDLTSTLNGACVRVAISQAKEEFNNHLILLAESEKI